MIKPWLGLAAIVLTVVPVQALTFRFTDEGLDIDGGGLLRVTMAYPQLRNAAEQPVHPVVDKEISGASAIVKYEGGTSARWQVTPEGVCTVEFSSPSPDIAKVVFSTQVPLYFNNGGTWSVDDQPAVAFPPVRPEKANLHGGFGGRVTLAPGDGRALSFQTPPGGWQELTDYRQWDTKAYGWKIYYPFDAGHSVFRFQIAAGGSAVQGHPLYDRFGQAVRGEWPGKLVSEEELRKDVAADDAYYRSLKPPRFDAYGGLPGSGEKLGLTKTGFFHVEKKDGKWHLVDPEGNQFFHLGVCCFSTATQTYIGGRQGDFEWIPPFEGEYHTAFQDARYRENFSFYLANLIRKYGRSIDEDEFSARMIPRVRGWGFNSVGAFSKPALVAWREAKFPFVLGLPVNPWDGLRHLPGLDRMIDPFDEATRSKFDQLCAEKVAPLAEEPLLIGYFLENEPLYEDLPRVLPTLKGSQHPCKRRMVARLKDKYGTIAAFNKAWNFSAPDFESLLDRSLIPATPAALADIKAAVDDYLEAYFSLMELTFRKYDRNHLLLGNRLQMGTINNESLCRIMARHVDVISFNYYTYALDTGFLAKIHRWTEGKPMLLSEFYWGSPSDSGLPGGVRDAASQRERGLAYRNYVEQAAALGYVIGIEWFTLVDQPVSGVWFGKYQGENGNTGLFDIADRPWKVAAEEMAKTNAIIYDVLLGRRPPFVYDNPRFQKAGNPHLSVKVARATGPITLDGASKNWPGIPAVALGTRLAQGAGRGDLEAAFKICWDDGKLYFHIQVADSTPLRNRQSGANLWSGDAVELFLGTRNLDQDGPLQPGDVQILLAPVSGSGSPAAHVVNAASQPEIEVKAIPAVDGQGYTLEAAIPLRALGFDPKPGDAILFDVALDDSADGTQRLRQLVWNGIDRNSNERGQWGRAIFIK